MAIREAKGDAQPIAPLLGEQRPILKVAFMCTESELGRWRRIGALIGGWQILPERVPLARPGKKLAPITMLGL